MTSGGKLIGVPRKLRCSVKRAWQNFLGSILFPSVFSIKPTPITDKPSADLRWLATWMMTWVSWDSDDLIKSAFAKAVILDVRFLRAFWGTRVNLNGGLQATACSSTCLLASLELWYQATKRPKYELSNLFPSCLSEKRLLNITAREYWLCDLSPFRILKKQSFLFIAAASKFLSSQESLPTYWFSCHHLNSYVRPDFNYSCRRGSSNGHGLVLDNQSIAAY